MKRSRYILTIVFSLLCLVATLYVLTVESGSEQSTATRWEAGVSSDSALIGLRADSLRRQLPPDAQPLRP